MARMTLLDVVSEILSDMTSDPVNSISDTFESQQVAKIVKRTYMNLLAERVWPHTGQLFKLTASGDASRPTHMLIEDEVESVEWVKYDCKRYGDTKADYQTIRYMRPEEFIELSMLRDSSEDNVETVIDYRGVPLFILNDAAPTYYTTFDDEHLVFDSYDSEIDSTLQSSKTQVFGYVEPEWRMEDSFVPLMPSKAFPLLVAEAKSQSFIKLKEVFSQKDEQAATRQRGWLSREKRRANPGTKYPDYGRPTPYQAKRRGNNYTG
jgi:hypothetical protein